MLDKAAVETSEQVRNACIDDITAIDEGAVVVSSVAGAGKSHLVSTIAGRLMDDGKTMAITCFTNEQAQGLVRSIALMHPTKKLAYLPASKVVIPSDISSLSNVTVIAGSDADHHQTVIGTSDKLADAVTRDGFDDARDYLLYDEAYQADAARYYGVAGISRAHLLVGDAGQLDPFSSARQAERWRGLQEDPVQGAIPMLLRNHPDTESRHHHLKVTRRLDARGAAVASAFYPAHGMDAVVPEGVRALTLSKGRKGSVDSILNHAASAGWAYVVLPPAPVTVDDPAIAVMLVGLAKRTLERSPRVRSEPAVGKRRQPERDVTQQDIAIAVSHNSQKQRVRALLDRADLGGVVCDTANRLQGLQYEVVLAWHPLAGLPDSDPFLLDPGRLAVMLTRHRHACIVVGRASDRDLIAGIPPATPTFVGIPGDPVLDGFDAHRTLFDRLDAHRFDIS